MCRVTLCWILLSGGCRGVGSFKLSFLIQLVHSRQASDTFIIWDLRFDMSHLWCEINYYYLKSFKIHCYLDIVFVHSQAKIQYKIKMFFSPPRHSWLQHWSRTTQRCCERPSTVAGRIVLVEYPGSQEVPLRYQLMPTWWSSPSRASHPSRSSPGSRVPPASWPDPPPRWPKILCPSDLNTMRKNINIYICYHLVSSRFFQMLVVSPLGIQEPL